MREISPEELSKILKEHKRWCDTGEEEGERADLRDADLRDANLRGANLSGADLSGADLSGADLREAGLRDADLSSADLTQVKNLSINNLSKVKTLYKAKLDPELMEQVKDEYPHLLEELEKEKLINPKMTRYFGISIKSASEIDKENEEDYEEEEE